MRMLSMMIPATNKGDEMMGFSIELVTMGSPFKCSPGGVATVSSPPSFELGGVAGGCSGGVSVSCSPSGCAAAPDAPDAHGATASSTLLLSITIWFLNHAL